MSTRLRLLAVLAHPDDESLGFGGTLAKYSAECVGTFLITATRGESGRIGPQGKSDDPVEAGRLREAELRAAAAELGVREITILGYPDGGVDQVEPSKAIREIAGHIRRVRPQVLVTFGPEGAYGHPDHIAICQFATAASLCAADPAYSTGTPDAAAHRIDKLYYMAWRKGKWDAYQEAFRKLTSTVDGVPRQATPWPEWAVTTEIETAEFWPVVWRAVRAHQTQLSIYERLEHLSEENHRALWGSQEFYRVFSTVNGGRVTETDLFEGLRGDGASAPAVTLSRQAPLAMRGDEFRRLGHALVDQIAGHLDSIRNRPVTPAESPATVRAALSSERGIPHEGADAGALLGRAADLLLNHSLFNGHPRFFGYITAGAAPIGVLGELLAAAVNPNSGAWKLSPMATEIEAQTVRWIAELIGFPAGCGGLLVSGGNMANITCFFAARAALAGWDVRREGIAGGPRLCVYASAETHTWIQKAVDLAGLGTNALRWIPVDKQQRMDLKALEAQLKRDVEEGLRPILVAGSAGTVSTGAVDPLREMAGFCRENGLWFHVDGAYGAFAAAAPGAPGDLQGMSLADSVAVDPHKWLYAPLEAGCALVRDPAALRNAFSYHPPYYSFDVEGINYYDYSPQNSRGFRALKVWLALQHAGASGYSKMIGDDIALARRLFELAETEPELEALTHNLSIATFRYVPSELRADFGPEATETYLNKLNQELQTAIENSGEAFFSNAVVSGKYALRFCSVNFRSSVEDIEALPELVLRLGRATHEKLQRSAS